LPGAVDAAAVIVTVLVVKLLVSDDGVNEDVTPAGAPSRLRSIFPANPPDRDPVTVTVPLAPCTRLSDVGVTLTPIAGVGFVPVLSSPPPQAAAAVAATSIANLLQPSRARSDSCGNFTTTSWVVVGLVILDVSISGILARGRHAHVAMRRNGFAKIIAGVF